MEQRLDALGSPRFTLTFFGGEPLLNLPVVYALAERMWNACRSRGVAMNISIITNGLLLTEAVVDRLLPYGLTGVKITLDGDRATHDRLRPLRGGQGTFDRILANMRAVAPKVRLSIGGNFDVDSAASYPELLALLRSEPFADRIAKIAFKPIIRGPNTGRAGAGTVVRTHGRRHADRFRWSSVDSRQAALGGTCMTAAGSGAGSRTPCDTCGLADERMSWLQGRNQGQRLRDARRAAHGPVRAAPPPLVHGGAGGLAVPVPRLHRRAGAADRPRRAGARPGASRGARSVRGARAVAGVRGLRAGPRLRWRLFGGCAQRAGRPRHAQLPRPGMLGGPGRDRVPRRQPCRSDQSRLVRGMHSARRRP